MRVSWITAYGVPRLSLEEGDGGNEDDVLSGEEEHPTVAGISSIRRSLQTPTPLPVPPSKNTRRTATIVEVEKARLAQAKEKN